MGLKNNEVKILKPMIGGLDTIIKMKLEGQKRQKLKPSKSKESLQYKNKKIYGKIVYLV